MANRHWVGGNGNYSDPRHWAEISGGPGGFSVPSMIDNTIFDNNSGVLGFSYVCTIDVNSVYGTLHVERPSPSYTLNIDGVGTTHATLTGYGSVYIGEGVINTLYGSQTSGWILRAPAGTTNTLECHSIMSSFSFYNGGTWELGSDYQMGVIESRLSTLLFLNGCTFRTNNYNIDGGSFQISSGNYTFEFGTTTWTNCREWLFQGTAVSCDFTNTTIYCNGRFYGRGQKYKKVDCNFLTSVTSTPALYDNNNEFDDLTLKAGHQGQFNTPVVISGTNKVNNNLSLLGIAENNRMYISSGTKGNQVNLICDGTITAQHVDLEDISASGTADWDLSGITGGSGDCGGNTGITFTPGMDVFFKTTSSSTQYYSTKSNWHFNSDGTGDGRAPLPQDSSHFMSNSFTGYGRQLNIDRNRIGKNIDFENIGLYPSITNQVEVGWYGDIKLGNMNWQSSQIMYAYGRGNYKIKCNGFDFPYTLNIYCPNGEYHLLNDFFMRTTAPFFGVRNGKFYSDGKSMDVPSLNMTARVGSTLTELLCDLSGSDIILRGNPSASLNTAPTGGQTSFNLANTRFILMNTALATFACGANLVYENLKIAGSAQANFTATTSFKFKKIEFDPITNINVLFPNTTLLYYDEMIGGGNPRAISTIKNTSGTIQSRWDKQNTNKNVLNYVNLQNINSIDTNVIYAVNSVNGGNNTNIIFGQPSELININRKSGLSDLVL